MPAEDPYQPPKDLNVSEEPQSPSDYWTLQRIFLLFLSPLVSTVIIYGGSSFWMSLGVPEDLLMPVALMLMTIVNVKLSAVLAGLSEYTFKAGRYLAIFMWFFVSGISQTMFALVLIYLLGFVFLLFS